MEFKVESAQMKRLFKKAGDVILNEGEESTDAYIILEGQVDVIKNNEVIATLHENSLFGEIGLYIYSAIAIIVANIQVLKLVKFSFFSEPIALGTVLFASTFLCTDILAEYYGAKKARINVKRTVLKSNGSGLKIIQAKILNIVLSINEDVIVEILFLNHKNFLFVNVASFSKNHTSKN